MSEKGHGFSSASVESHELREELNRYLSAVSCGILQYTKFSHRLAYANDIALDILGYSSMEELQTDFESGVAGTVHPEDVKNIDHLVSTLKNEEDKVEYQYRVTLRDGTKRVCYGAARLILQGDNEPLIQRTIIDVSDTRDHAREESEAVVSTLTDAFASVYLLDVATMTYRRIVEREPSVTSFPDEAPWSENFAKYVETLMDPSYREPFQELINREGIIEKLSHNKLIIEYQRMDGTWRCAFFLPSEYDRDGELISVVFAVRNIEEEKTRELETQKALKEAYAAAQLASAAKTTFLSNMSHDIRTPLNGIIGMASIAEAHIDDPEKIMDCLKKINSSGKHLLGLINQILDMSKIESGKVDLHEEEFNFSEMLNQVISINHAAGRAKKQELKVRINNLVHENVIGDRTRLEQVFTNLLSNAVKYTQEGGCIEIEADEKETNKTSVGWYEVVIKDNGIGMSKDFIKNIFEPFSRASDERAMTEQGTGLGMPIARNIVRMMNGDITVESELNKGSTFTVSFALKIQPEQTAEKENINGNTADKTQPAGTDGAVDFTGKRILLAEDNALNTEIAVELLSMTGVEIEVRENGKLCFEEFVSSPAGHYDMIFMDIQMPVMNGYEAAKAIRASEHPDAETIPIVAMTANAFSTDVREAFDSGMNGHISKPIDMNAVIKTMQKYLG
ncbi:MAG: response regulator [Parasporobacterium sp.]|nr:response regulator [Parasporobacterium sp.]